MDAIIATCLDAATAAGYRRKGAALYEEIVLDAGDGAKIQTRAWRRAHDMADFVQATITREANPKGWALLASRPAVRRGVVEHLTAHKEAALPDLVVDRHWFAFKNGLLHTDRGSFYEWTDPAIPPDVVACRYLPSDFDVRWLEVEDWYGGIETPTVQSILEYQLAYIAREQGEAAMHAVLQWWYVAAGRTLFDGCEKDAWLVDMGLFGPVGVGKWSLASAVADFFEVADIARVDEEWEWEDGARALAWVATRLPSLGCWSLFLGEERGPPGIYVLTGDVTTTGVAPALCRRILPFRFSRRVTPDAMDPHLNYRLKAQTPALLFKCCMAYLSAVGEYGARDLWGTTSITLPDGSTARKPILPAFFHEGKQLMGAALVHPMELFIRGATDVIACVAADTVGVRVGMP